MTAKKPSQTWRLMISTAGSVQERKFRSQPAAYKAVAEEKERIEQGTSRVSRIRVEQWNVDGARWELFEIAYPA